MLVMTMLETKQRRCCQTSYLPRASTVSPDGRGPGDLLGTVLLLHYNALMQIRSFATAHKPISVAGMQSSWLHCFALQCNNCSLLPIEVGGLEAQSANQSTEASSLCVRAEVGGEREAIDKKEKEWIG